MDMASIGDAEEAEAMVNHGEAKVHVAGVSGEGGRAGDGGA